MSPEAVMALLSYEFYKISARPLLGGRPGERARPALPGARSPNLQIALTPEKIEPFIQRLRTASAFAVRTLRDEIGNTGISDDAAAIAAPAAPEPSLNGPEAKPHARNTTIAAAKSNRVPSTNGAEPPRQRTAAEAKLGGLLKRMSELAEASSTDPTAEVEYQAISAEVASTQAEVDAEQRGTRHGR